MLGLYHPIVTQAIAEPPKPPKSCVTPPGGQFAAPGADENAVHGRQTL
jgi:hypothetical protein